MRTVHFSNKQKQDQCTHTQPKFFVANTHGQREHEHIQTRTNHNVKGNAHAYKYMHILCVVSTWFSEAFRWNRIEKKNGASSSHASTYFKRWIVCQLNTCTAVVMLLYRFSSSFEYLECVVDTLGRVVSHRNTVHIQHVRENDMRLRGQITCRSILNWRNLLFDGNNKLHWIVCTWNGGASALSTV